MAVKTDDVACGGKDAVTGGSGAFGLTNENKRTNCYQNVTNITFFLY